MTQLAHKIEPDELLLARHQRGDSKAFEELVKRYWGQLNNYLFRCGVGEATREDLLQEVFAKIHRGAHTYRPERPLRVWIYAVAANTMRSYFRRKSAREGKGVRIEISPDELSSPQPSHQAIAEANETLNCLAMAVGRLPLAQRDALVLCAIEGLDMAEAAEVLDVPLNTLKTQLRRARFTLAKALARHRLCADRQVSQ